MTNEQTIIARRLIDAQIADRKVTNKAMADKFPTDRKPVNIKAEVEQRDKEIDALEAVLALIEPNVDGDR